MKNTQKIKLLHYFIISLLLFSCNNFNGFKISGNIKNAEKTKVYLEDILTTTPVIIDTTTIINNTFNLDNYSSKGIYRLRFGDDVKNSIYLFIDKKDNIKITADFNNLDTYKVAGSKASESIQQMIKTSNIAFQNLSLLSDEIRKGNPNSKDSLQKLLLLGKKNQVDYIKDFVEKEQNNDVACFALNFLGPMMQDEIPYLANITVRLHDADPKSKYINTMYKEFQQYAQAAMDETEGGVAINTQAPNIILQTPNGDTIQLKYLAGNYVLLDFWASWCQPCRMENPNVVKLYNQYHAQGFEVFSVSLDANVEQWKMAIKKDGLVWKNHGSDLGGWNSAAAQMYSVKSIPSTYLLDKKGKVIAKNLSSEQLSAKLAELYPEKIN